jgi:hypothetical protein
VLKSRRGFGKISWKQSGQNGLGKTCYRSLVDPDQTVQRGVYFERMEGARNSDHFAPEDFSNVL